MAGKATETLMKTENRTEAEAVLEMLEEMDQNERKDFLVFMQGIRFAKGMTTNTPAPEVQKA